MVTMAFVLYLLVIIFVFKKKFYFSLSFCSQVFLKQERKNYYHCTFAKSQKQKNKTPVRGLLADPIPNSPNSLRKNCIADSKDNN